MNDLVMRLNAFEELRRRVRIAAGLEDQRRFWMRLDRERASNRPNQALIQDRAYQDVMRQVRRPGGVGDEL